MLAIYQIHSSPFSFVVVEVESDDITKLIDLCAELEYPGPISGTE